MSSIELRSLQTCDSCRELNMECEGSPCSTCVANQVQCEGTLARFNQDMSGFIFGNHAAQDYQMQLMILEQQNKRRLLMARTEQDNASSSAVRSIQDFTGTGQNHILCAAQSAPPLAWYHQPVTAGASATPHNQNPARQDYQMQLMLLEQQNKKRLLQARARGNNT